MESTQNFENHSRRDYKRLFLFLGRVFMALLIYWGVFAYLIPLNFGGSRVLGTNSGFMLWGKLMSIFLIFVPVIQFVLILTLRRYATTLQDRIIKLEEECRFTRLTGKLPDSRLTLRQIIALRFASDEELVELAAQAVEKDLKPKAIKQMIKNWRSDEMRV